MTGDTLTDVTLVAFGFLIVAGVAVLVYVVPLLVLDELVNLREWWHAGRPDAGFPYDGWRPGDPVRLAPGYEAGVPEPGAPPPPGVVEVRPLGDVWDAVAAFQGVVVRPVRDRARLALDRAPAA